VRKMNGVVTGIVKSLDDPSGQARIELQFPWLSESQRSSWAPVASALAGKSRGAFFMPEVNDEVLVAFEHGDFDHPFIVGFLWNGVDKPPEETNQNRIIKTPGGHTLRFEDKAGARRIVVRTDGGHEITMDDASNTITVKGSSGNVKITMNDTANSVEMVGGNRSIQMQAGIVQIN